MAGMELEKSAIGVTTPTIGVQRFRTNDMPDPGAATLAGTQKLAGTIQSINDQTMKDDADQAAKDAAGKAVIAKDADGNYLYPPAPDTFGSYARKAYEGLVDSQYKNQVLADAQLKFNEIGTQKALKPQEAISDMAAYSQGVMKSVDPRFAGVVQAGLTHELAQRQHGLLQTNFALDRAQTIATSQATIARNEDDALERAIRGDTAGADALMAENFELKKNIAGLKSGAEFDEAVEQTGATSIQTAAAVMKTLREKVTDGSISQDQLDKVLARLNGYTTKDAAPVLGVDDNVVSQGLQNPAVRKLLINKVTGLRSELAPQLAAQQKQLEYDGMMRFYDAGARGSLGLSSDKSDALITTWADKTLPGGRLALQTPDGVKQAFQKFGLLPDKSLGETFRGVQAWDGKAVAERHALWKQLDNMPSLDGGNAVSLRGSVPADADAFLKQYDLALTATANPAQALAAAKEVAKGGASAEIANQGKGGLIKFYAGPMGANDPNVDEAHLYEKLDKHLPPTPGTLWGSYKMLNLPARVRDDMIALTNQRLAQPGTSLDDAMSWAGAHITKMWTPDPKVLGGWARGTAAIPQAIGPDGRASTDYTTKYWEAIRDSGKFSLAGDVAIPKDAAEGKNILYRPNANGTFDVFYKAGSGPNDLVPVVDKATHSPLVLNFGQAARKQGNAIQDQIQANEAAHREALVAAKTPSKAPAYNPLSGEASISSGGITDPVIDAARGVDPKRLETARQRLGSIRKETDVNDPDKLATPTREVDWDKADLSDVVRPSTGPSLMPPARLDKPNKRQIPAGGLGEGDGSAPLNIRPGVSLDLREPVKAVMASISEKFPGIQFTSGYRDPAHNAAVGGAHDSQHVHHNAFDLSLQGLSIADRGRLMDHITAQPDVGGIGYYPNSDSMHIDLRDGKAAWGGNRSRSSLPNTPDWYQRRILPWLNDRT